jgi:AcrR family transcriptional regulator
MEPGTLRSRAKAERRSALLEAATTLFAERGFLQASLEEIGAVAGVSGPAVYRHFANKQAVLAAILIETSTTLLDGGRDVIARGDAAAATMGALVDFHVDFALGGTEVIRIQDRDLDKLGEPDRHTVRSAQRAYVELWVEVLQNLHPDETAASLRTRAHGVFGLMNSTSHTEIRGPQTGTVLRATALAALFAALP